jgi:hypothetical protein
MTMGNIQNLGVQIPHEIIQYWGWFLAAFDPKRILTCKSLKPSGPMTARWPQLVPRRAKRDGAKKLLWNNANQFTRTALIFLRTAIFY